MVPAVSISNIKVPNLNPKANNDKEPPIVSFQTAAFTVRSYSNFLHHFLHLY